MNALLAIACAGCLLLAASCSSQPAQPEQAADLPVSAQAEVVQLSPSLSDGLPGLDSLPQQQRSASNVPEDFLRDGYQTYQPDAFANASIVGNMLVMVADYEPAAEPPTRELSWAIYGFNITDFQRQPELQVLWEGPRPDGARHYIGVSDFSSNRWQWFQGTDQDIIDFGSLDGYFSGNGDIYFTILVADKGNFNLSRLRLGENLPPVASLIPNQTSGTGSLEVQFDASGCHDPDGSIAGYEWSMEDPDYTDFRYPAPVVFWTYDHAGEYTCTLRLTDNDGATAELSIPISVALVDGNAAPLASIVPDTSGGPVPQWINFDCSGSSDTDGSIAGYRFDFDGDGHFEIFGSAVQKWFFAEPGSYEISVMAIDNQGSFGTASTTVVIDPVDGTEPPTIVVKSDYSFNSPGAFRIDWSESSDPDNDIVSFETDLEGDGIFDYSFAPGEEFVATYAQTGQTFNATFRVTDSGGRTDVASIPLRIGPNSGLAETEPNGTPGEAEEFTGFMNYSKGICNWKGSLDEGGGDSADWYSFESDRSGPVAFVADFLRSEIDMRLDLYSAGDTDNPLASSHGIVDKEILKFELPAAGHYLIRVSIDPSALAKGPGDYTFRCRNYDGPHAALSADPLFGSVPFDISLDASASTVEMGYITEYQFDVDGDGIFEVTGQFQPTYDTQITVPGAIVVSVRVIDEWGLADTDFVIVTALPI